MAIIFKNEKGTKSVLEKNHSLLFWCGCPKNQQVQNLEEEIEKNSTTDEKSVILTPTV